LTDQRSGGVASFFENIRTNTFAISQSHHETERAIKGVVLPILERLHREIKEKAKHIQSTSDKSSKAVAKARNHTQNHIELLGQHVSSFESMGSSHKQPSGGLIHIQIPGTHSHADSAKVKPETDPYLLQRGVLYRLHRQVIEENNHRQELLGAQNQVQLFEAHVVQTIQHALGAFYEHVGAQCDRQKALYGDITGMLFSLPVLFRYFFFFFELLSVGHCAWSSCWAEAPA
jgi:hypothetical protein